MSDWKKLEAIAKHQKALAELAEAIIEAQTETKVHPYRVEAAKQAVRETYFALQGEVI